MNKADFLKALSSYEYHLRAACDPNIDRFFYNGHLPFVHKTYFILGIATLSSIIRVYLNPMLEIDPSIVSDNYVKSRSDFFGIFVYDQLYNTVTVSGVRDFKDGERSVSTMIDEINDFVYKNTLLSGTILPQGISNGFNKFEPVKPATLCDCGAFKLGYKDSDDYGHAAWCSVFGAKNPKQI